MKTQYKVIMICVMGWVQWSDAFESISEAQIYIDEYLDDCKQAVLEGHMSDSYSQEDFKIVKLETLEKDYDYIKGE